MNANKAQVHFEQMGNDTQDEIVFQYLTEYKGYSENEALIYQSSTEEETEAAKDEFYEWLSKRLPDEADSDR